MAKIVLIHGIDQQFRSADELEAEWIPALAGGVRIAGSPNLADAIVAGSVSVRMAFYGDWFRSQVQGGYGHGIDDFQNTALMEALALEWLQRATESEREAVRHAAERELRGLTRSESGRQGIGNVTRSAISALMHVPLFADLGMNFLKGFLWTTLGQVTDYFEKPDLRDDILKKVANLLDGNTTVLIGHSLGSIIAYEAAHALRSPLQLLVTLGSPIGVRNVVFERLTPAPPSLPPQLRRWCNVADREDFIAAVSDLGPLISRGSAGGIFDNHLVNNGARPHNVAPYLNCAIVGAAIASAFPRA